MASDESMSLFSSSMQEDDYDHDDITDDGYDHHPHLHNLSRLSVCTSSMYTNEDFDLDCDGMRMSMSRLYVESFDADEEFSDGKEGKTMLDLSSDSDKETGCCYSLPATPPRRRNREEKINQVAATKDYASENEAHKGLMRQKMRKNLRKRRSVREKWADSDNNNSGKKDEESSLGANSLGYCNSFSGESEGGGLMVITRPKGGGRSLCMDLGEVKACRDLGFELEHERMMEMPNRGSRSGSTLDTSSGGNSPIANWRISGPGDDPRDVKARLKVWAQAVAIASATQYGGL